MKRCARLQRSAHGVAGSGFRAKRTFRPRRTCANPEQLPGDGTSQPAPQQLPVVDSAVLMPTARKWHWSKSMQGILLGVGLLLGGCQLAKRVEVWESWAESAEGIVLEMEDHADPRTFWGRLNPHHDLKVGFREGDGLMADRQFTFYASVGQYKHRKTFERVHCDRLAARLTVLYDPDAPEDARLDDGQHTGLAQVLIYVGTWTTFLCAAATVLQLVDRYKSSAAQATASGGGGGGGGSGGGGGGGGGGSVITQTALEDELSAARQAAAEAAGAVPEAALQVAAAIAVGSTAGGLMGTLPLLSRTGAVQAADQDVSTWGAGPQPTRTDADTLQSGELQSMELQSGELQSRELQSGERQSGVPQNGEPQSGELQRAEPQSGELQSGEPQSGELQRGELQGGPEAAADASMPQSEPAAALEEPPSTTADGGEAEPTGGDDSL